MIFAGCGLSAWELHHILGQLKILGGSKTYGGGWFAYTEKLNRLNPLLFNQDTHGYLLLLTNPWVDLLINWIHLSIVISGVGIELVCHISQDCSHTMS